MKQMRTSIVLLLSIVLISSASFAGVKSAPAFPISVELTFEYQQTFQYTKRLCNDFRVSDALYLTSDSVQTGLMSFGSTLTDLLKSAAFYDALNVCYGSDQTNKELFVGALMAADASGKFLIGAALMAGQRLFGGAMGALKAWNLNAYRVALVGTTTLIISGSIEAGKEAKAKIKSEHMKAIQEKDPTLYQVMRDVEEGRLTQEQMGDRYLSKTLDQLQGTIEELNRALLDDLDRKEERLKAKIASSKSEEKRKKFEDALSKVQSARNDLLHPDFAIEQP